MKNWKNRKLLIGVLLVYGLACALPAWWRYGEPVYGIECLLNPLALLTLFWWANPLFFAGCAALCAGPVVSGDGSRDCGHGPRDELLPSFQYSRREGERDWLCILGGGHGVPGDRRILRGSVRGGRQRSLRIDVW